MELKITKRVLLEEQNNDMCHNWFFLVYGKILNDEKTKSRKFHFIEWLDVFDIQDWSDDGTHSHENVMGYLNECIDARLNLINSFDDCQNFYDSCNESIKWWNDRINKRNYAY